MIPGLPPLKVIETQTLDEAAASVTMPASGAIADLAPSGSRHLVILVNARGSNASVDREVPVQFNGDTGSNYHQQRLQGYSSTVSADRSSSRADVNLFSIPAASQASEVFGGGWLMVPHYAGTDGHKAVIGSGGPSETKVWANTGRWANTAAITTVLLKPGSGNFTAGSVFKLCVVDEDYRYHATDGEVILGSDGTFTFDSLPDAAGDLSVIGYLRGDVSAANTNASLFLNDDTTNANYARQTLQGYGTTANGDAVADARAMSGFPGDDADANAFGAGILTVQQHALGDNDPHVLAIAGAHRTSSSSQIAVTSLRRNNVEKVTKALVQPTTGTNFKSGSMMSVYHVPKVLLERQSVGAGGATSVTFTLSGLSIPTNVKDLRLNYYARSDRSYTATNIDIELNSSAADFYRQDLTGSGSSVSVNATADNLIGEIPADSATANIFGGGTILIPEYSKTDRHKHLLNLSGHTGSNVLTARSMRWAQTAAIATIVLKDTYDTGAKFMEGSIFELEGIGDLAGWQGTVMGVANPGKVMGVERANIAKVMGVA